MSAIIKVCHTEILNTATACWINNYKNILKKSWILSKDLLYLTNKIKYYMCNSSSEMMLFYYKEIDDSAMDIGKSQHNSVCTLQQTNHFLHGYIETILCVERVCRIL